MAQKYSRVVHMHVCTTQLATTVHQHSAHTPPRAMTHAIAKQIVAGGCAGDVGRWSLLEQRHR